MVRSKMSKDAEKSKNQEPSSPIGILEDYFRTPESDDTNSSSESELCKQRSSSGRWGGLMKILLIAKSKSQQPPLSTLKQLSRWSSSSSSSRRERLCCHEWDSPSNDFSLSELQSATANFSQGNLIGKGGYAEVYKGRLQDGRIVAIKRLIKGTSDDKTAEFLAELGIMAHVNHPNAAKLIGYGTDGGMHLVLEYSELGSLASHLHGGSKDKIRWHVRYKVAIGIAEGLTYLHERCQRRIIHRDIKAANILLSTNFEPQICDFGLAKWLPEKWTHHTISKFEGTFGYLAPEYLMHGIVDEKTDVFSFGVLLLELITGRRALDCSQQSLVLWAKPLLKNGSVKELIDSSLGKDYDSRQMNLMLLAASLCIQRSSIRRPSMSQLVGRVETNQNP
ncbi:hypothetical protein V2J09_021337 [Rumex salicifolius]